MYKGNNTNNKSTRLNNVLNSAEGKNNYYVFKIIIRKHDSTNFEKWCKPI